MISQGLYNIHSKKVSIKDFYRFLEKITIGEEKILTGGKTVANILSITLNTL